MDYYKQQKELLERALRGLECVEEVYFTYMDGERIRRYVNMDYNGGGKEVMVVNYKPELCAYSNSVASWEYLRPDEAVNMLEI